MSTTAVHPKLTIPSLRAFFARADVRSAQRTVRSARAAKRTTTERVRSYTVPLLATFGILEERTGAPITDPDRLYLCRGCDEQACLRFYDACDAAHTQHGYVVPRGRCPALTAGHELIRAERRLADLAAEHLGLDMRTATLDLFAKGVEMLLNPPRA